MKTTAYYLMTILLIGATSCGDDDSDVKQEDNITSFRGTQSPGDVWEWELNHDSETFTASWDHGSFDDETDDYLVEGSFITLESGYLKCTISNVTPSAEEIPTDGSAYFYAMHLPNMAMVIKPEGSIKGDMISTVASGDCADVSGDYNYIMIAPGNGEAYDPNTEEAYGQVSFDVSGDGYAISGEKYSLDCANDGNCTESGMITGLPTATCTEGGQVEIISDDTDEETAAQGQFTAAGVMMLDMGEGNGGVLALQQSSSLVIDDLDNEEFVGFAYIPNNNNDKTVPINISFADNGEAILGTAKIIDDIIDGTLSDAVASLKFESLDNGLGLGEITHSDQITTNFVASMAESGGKKMIILSSTGSEGDAFILILVNK